MTLFMGYHGTESDLAQNIFDTNFEIQTEFNIKNNKIGWLGHGAYFFEENPIMAKNWGSDRYKGSSISVLECELEVPDAEIFDITCPLSQASKDFHEFREKFIEQIYEHKFDVSAYNNGDLDGKILEIIARKDGYKLIRACTYTFQEIDEICETFSRISNGIELCVKDLDYIKSKKIMPR